MSETKNFSDNDFEVNVTQSKGLVLIDFWAEWCGPCRMLAPHLEELAIELDGKVTIAKINIDENPETPTKFGVRSIPTLMIFKDGVHVDTKVGGVPKSSLKEWIESKM